MAQSSGGVVRGSNSSSIPNFSLLNRDGYSSWKFKMRNYLMHEDLWEAIEGYPQGHNIPADTLCKLDKKALTKICLTLDGSAITQVRSARTAAEAWHALQYAYEDKGMGRRLYLERRLYRYCLSDFPNIESYINAVMATVHDLSDIGKTIEDTSVAAILLGGLTSRFEPLIMALENSNQTVTTELVKGKLLNEMSKSQDLTKIDSALRSRDVKPRKAKKPIICYDCNEPGHKRPDCPLKKKAKKKAQEAASLVALGTSGNVSEGYWTIDSGATQHMTSRLEWFENLRSTKSNQEITIANGTKIDVGGIGDISIGTNSSVNKVNDVIYVPSLNSNLISVYKAVEKGFSVLFDKNGCNFFNSDTFSFVGDSILHGSPYRGLYKLDCTVNMPRDVAYDVHSDSASRYQLWHKRLGHLCRIGMNQLRNSHVGVEFTEIDKQSCVACVEGKQARKPFKKVVYKQATSLLELVHSDVCGPMTDTSFQGNKYALLFVDDYTRFIFIYFISSKTEVKEKFCHFQSLLERQTGAKVKAVRTDNGGEYVNHDLSEHFRANGIVHQTTVVYSPQQNGVAERTIRSVVEKARSMLAQSSLSKVYWEDAVQTSVYLKNRSPHRALNNLTPFEKFYNRKPNLSHLRVFGCRALIHVPECQRKKLDMKAVECIFVGYSDDPNSYMFRDAEYPRRFTKSRDVTFFEDCFTGLKNNKNDNPCTMSPVHEQINRSVEFPVPVSEEHVLPEVTPHSIDKTSDMSQEEFHDASADPLLGTKSDFQSETEEIENCPVTEERRYPSRDRKPPDYYSYNTCVQNSEPQTYFEAMRDDDADNWKLAMNNEYDSLMKFNTWKLVDRPKRKIIPCKWVYKVKTDEHGNITRYKARLVIKGFNQVEGVDYHETFSPVVRHSSLRTLFALAAEMDLKMHQFDVDTAFLNGDLEEEVFMHQPQGFVKKGDEDKVCLLQKSLYGLKQAPRAWNIKLYQTLTEIGFNRLSTEPCVYKKLLGSEIIILAVFVDDVIVFYKNDTSLVNVKNDLQKYFSLKDLGPLKYYLGLNIDSNAGKIRINQKTYISSLLKKFALENAKEFNTPLANSKLAADVEGKELNYDYQQIIGCLMYLAVNTRPDIAFAASYLSQFNHKCGKTHFLAAKRVLQYLKHTIDYSIVYKKTGQLLEGSADADWANCTSDRRSYTGYCFRLADGPVSWASKKQPTVALSSTEAEYMALTEAAKEAIYLRSFISQVCGTQYPTITLQSDSQSAQNLAYNPVHHGRTKHIDTKFHFIREKVTDGVIRLKFVRSSDMSADVLTKCLGKTAHLRCIQGIGLVS